MNVLKAKMTIHCTTCGCAMKRTKTIKVEADTKEEAMREGAAKANKWKASLKGQNCKVCASIIKDLAV